MQKSTLTRLSLAAPAILGLMLATASPSAAQAPAAAPAAAPNTWTIDSSHTQSGFAVKHMMVSTVRGSFGKTEGTITFDGKDVSSIKADVTIDATTITTNNEKRDTHLKSKDFFDVAGFPTITFKSKKAEAAGAGKFKVVGDLTIRGVTKEVTLDVEGPSQPLIAQGRARRRDRDHEGEPAGLRRQLEPLARRRRRGGQRRSGDHDRNGAGQASCRRPDRPVGRRPATTGAPRSASSVVFG